MCNCIYLCSIIFVYGDMCRIEKRGLQFLNSAHIADFSHVGIFFALLGQFSLGNFGKCEKSHKRLYLIKKFRIENFNFFHFSKTLSTVLSKQHPQSGICLREISCEAIKQA